MFKGVIRGEFPETSLPTPQELLLKVGAQVLFVKNDMDHRWVNGTLGTVIGFDDDSHDRNSTCAPRTAASWMWSARYGATCATPSTRPRRRSRRRSWAPTRSFPIRLAWAITVHKSQGLTFSHVKIDFTGGVFAGGQTYVALSRCTSLEGIVLKDPIRRNDVFVRAEVLNFAKHYNDESIINTALKQSKADKEYWDAVQAFDRGDMQAALDAFFLAIHSRYDIEKPVPRRYIRRKLDIINRQRSEIEHLKAEAERKEAFLKELAVEYVVMGRRV
jgi:hypothetical protein